MKSHCATFGALFAGLLLSESPLAAGNNNAESVTTGILESVFTLPRLPLREVGNLHLSESEIQKSQTNGLQFTDLPSIGSGLASVSGNEFVGITDRGPNGRAAFSETQKPVRTFPLPRFCPSIIRFRLEKQGIVILETIPLTDSSGHKVTGLSNVPGDELLHDTPDAEAPIPFDQGGVDPEAIRILPGVGYLLSEEYSPSILVVNQKGQILVRYTPVSKPLPLCPYPVKAILPDIFSQRVLNHGFESLALSRDGRFAWAILQSPMGDDKDPDFADKSIFRSLKLDLADPLNAVVTAEYLIRSPAEPAPSESGKKREKITFTDAEWISADSLLVLERRKSEARLVKIDFSRASNVLKLPESARLTYESRQASLTALGLAPAEITEVLSADSLREIGAEKLEGLAILGPSSVAVSNDNDFGMGANEDGTPSRVWTLRLPAPLAGFH